MNVLAVLTDEQIRTALVIAKLTGKTVGGYQQADLERELNDRRTPPQVPGQLEIKTPEIIKGINQAAEFIGISPRTLARQIDDWPHFKAGRAYYFDKDKLLAEMDARTAGGTHGN